MNKSFKRFLQLFFITLDIALLNAFYLITQSIFEEDAESQYFMRYAQYWMLMNGFWLLLALLGKVYATRNINSFERFLKTSIKVYIFWAGINLLYLFLPRVVQLSRPLVFSTVALFFVGILFNRFLYLGIKEWVRREMHLHRKVLIVGNNNLAQTLTAYLEKEGFGVEIMGYVDDKAVTNSNLKYPVFNKLEDTLAVANRLRVNEIYSTIMPENNAKVYRVMQQADKELIRFKLVPDFSYLIDKPVQVDYLYDMLMVLTVRKEPLQQEMNRFIKRVFDIVVSSLVTVFILSWLIPLVGLLIKLESKGPIFFVQLRSGKDNKPFRCYKFRSMGANNKTEAVQATKNDIRITRIGRILRKTSLDEFPQFLNVLKGEMSVVGPRPHMLKHTKNFSSMADDYMIRQFLKPGITGWAQVNGYRGEITELHHIKKRVEHDLWYLENWSLWLEIRIMYLTVYNVVKGEENAY